MSEKLSRRLYQNPDVGSFSNRPAVRALDDSSASLPSGDNVVVDGVLIKSGRRVLFTALSDPNDNNKVYKLVAVRGALEFKLESDLQANADGSAKPGNILLIKQGDANSQRLFAFDGLNDVWLHQTLDIDAAGDFLKDGSAKATGAFCMDSNTVKELPTPTSDDHAANKKFVDDSIAAIPPVAPGGVDTNIQFNDSGVFGGESDLTWNKTTNIMKLGTGVGALILEQAKLTFGTASRLSASSNKIFIQNSSGSNRVQLGDGGIVLQPGGQNLKWSADGLGDIGATSDSRPDNVHVKTAVLTPTLTLASGGAIESSGTINVIADGAERFIVRAADIRLQNLPIVWKNDGVFGNNIGDFSSGRPDKVHVKTSMIVNSLTRYKDGTVAIDDDTANDGVQAASYIIQAANKAGGASTGPGGDVVLSPGTSVGSTAGLVTVPASGGMTIGAPTGGGQGDGTLNVDSGLFVNGVAVGGDSFAGADKQIQFNDGAATPGTDASLTWDKSAKELEVDIGTNNFIIRNSNTNSGFPQIGSTVSGTFKTGFTCLSNLLKTNVESGSPMSWRSNKTEANNDIEMASYVDIFWSTDSSGQIGGGLTTNRPRHAYVGLDVVVNGANYLQAQGGIEGKVIYVEHNIANDDGGLFAVDALNNAEGGRLNLINYNAETAMGSGDALGIIEFRGHDGTGTAKDDVIRSAAILAKATETWGAAAVGSELLFRTTVNGATSQTDQMTLSNDGGLVMDGATGGSQGSGSINTTGIFKDGVEVVGAAAGPPSIRATRTTTQTISSGSNTTIVFNSAGGFLGFNPDGDYDSSTGIYTVPTTGIYLVCFNVISDTKAFTLADLISFKLRYGANTQTMNWSSSDTASHRVVKSASTIVKVSATDTIKLQVRQDTGTDMDILAATENNFLSISFLGAT